MADEMQMSFAMRGLLTTMGDAHGMSVVGQLLSQVTSNAKMIAGVISVATTATVIPVGGVTAPHLAGFYNDDSTNFVKIRNGSSGADVLRIPAGKKICVLLEPTGTYYAIADTAACLLHYVIFDR